jgi:hypothetical protein
VIDIANIEAKGRIEMVTKAKLRKKHNYYSIRYRNPDNGRMYAGYVEADTAEAAKRKWQRHYGRNYPALSVRKVKRVRSGFEVL